MQIFSQKKEIKIETVGTLHKSSACLSDMMISIKCIKKHQYQSSGSQILNVPIISYCFPHVITVNTKTNDNCVNFNWTSLGRLTKKAAPILREPVPDMPCIVEFCNRKYLHHLTPIWKIKHAIWTLLQSTNTVSIKNCSLNVYNHDWHKTLCQIWIRKQGVLAQFKFWQQSLKYKVSKKFIPRQSWKEIPAFTRNHHFPY